jgi:hypothetical protein
MPGSRRLQRRVAVAFPVLMAALGAGCTEASNEGRTRASATSNAKGEVCLVGHPTEEGVECQAYRADDGGLYTLLGNLAGLAGDAVCICGRPAEFSTCMQGTTLAVTRIGPPGTCR